MSPGNQARFIMRARAHGADYARTSPRRFLESGIRETRTRNGTSVYMAARNPSRVYERSQSARALLMDPPPTFSRCKFIDDT